MGGGRWGRFRSSGGGELGEGGLELGARVRRDEGDGQEVRQRGLL